MEAVSPPAASFWHRCTMQEFLGPQPCGQSLCACRRNTCPRLQASGTENCGTEGMSGQERSVGVLRQEAIFPDQLPVKRASSKRSAFSSFDRLHYRGKIASAGCYSEAMSAHPSASPRYAAGCAPLNSAQQQAVTCQLAAGGFLEHGEQILDGQVRFFLAADVEEDVPVVHHDQAVAEAQGVAHVVGDHQGG